MIYVIKKITKTRFVSSYSCMTTLNSAVITSITQRITEQFIDMYNFIVIVSKAIMCKMNIVMAVIYIQVFHDKIKFYILRQNLHQTCFNDFSNVKWCMKQTSI